MAAAASPIEFELEKTLGEGAFGKVFLCCDKTDKTQKVHYFTYFFLYSN